MVICASHLHATTSNWCAPSLSVLTRRTRASALKHEPMDIRRLPHPLAQAAPGFGPRWRWSSEACSGSWRSCCQQKRPSKNNRESIQRRMVACDKASTLCFRAAMLQPSPFRLLLRLAGRYPWRVAAGLSMAILGTLLGFVLPNTTRWIIDEVIPQKDMTRLWHVALLTLGAMLLRQVLFSLRTLANGAFYLRMTYDLRSSLHEKIQRLPLKWFDRQSTGDVIVRMSDDVPATQRAILDGVDQFIPALLSIIITVIIMLSLHVKLTLVTLIPV